VRPVLCLVTDRRRCGGEDRLVQIVREAAAAGVHLVQLREKDLEGRWLYELARRCVAAARGTRTRVLVSDRLDVALAAGAHGVHLPSRGVPAARARAVAPPGFLIGRSVHAVDEGRTATERGGLDYLIFGTVFATASKPGIAPAGLDALRELAAAVPLPVLAIGGMAPGRLPAVAAAGAAGFAAIGFFQDLLEPPGNSLQIRVKQATLAFDTHRGVPYHGRGDGDG
jgi:thiamine-phosphate diphosphorylase